MTARRRRPTPVELVGWEVHRSSYPTPGLLTVTLHVDPVVPLELVAARLVETVRDLAAELNPVDHPELAVEVTRRPDGTATAYLGGAADDELFLDPGRTFPITLALDRDDHTRESALQLAAGLRALVRVLDEGTAAAATAAPPTEESP